MTNAKVICLYHADAYRVGLLATSGEKWVQVIVMESPITVVRVPAEREIEFQYLEHDPVRAARQFLAAAEGLRITDTARALCERIARGEL